VLTGAQIRPGDTVIGIRSSGLHTNGYSLARKVIFDKMGLGVFDTLPGFDKVIVADALLAPHTNYARLIADTQAKFNKAGKPSEIREGNSFFSARAHHRQRPLRQHPARHPGKHRHRDRHQGVGASADLQGAFREQRRLLRRELRGLEHGHRHDLHRGSGSRGRNPRLHPFAGLHGVAIGQAVKGTQVVHLKR
jgi:hypothetical protein